MGVGGALVMPATLSILVDVFPPQERQPAIGIWTGMAALGFPLGPIVGGWIVEHAGWNAVFLLNLPVALVALGAGLVLVPECRDPRGRLTWRAPVCRWRRSARWSLASIEAPARRGWFDSAVLGALAVSVCAGVGFVLCELHAERPMLDLRWFTDRRHSLGLPRSPLARCAWPG